MNKAKPGDIVREGDLGRGMVVYYEVEGKPVIAFPLNPELVVCDDGSVEVIININDLK